MVEVAVEEQARVEDEVRAARVMQMGRRVTSVA